jgi:flagellar basal body P-ring protein FlgI
MRFKFLNVKSTFEELDSKMRLEVSGSDRKTVNRMTDELRDRTPVDTGKARDSWSIETTPNGFNVVNSVDYIDKLNQGSSQQAPAFFVESTALKYGTPKGAIVEIS